MQRETNEEERQYLTNKTNNLTAQKQLGKSFGGDVSNRISLFHEKADALAKGTPQWTICPEDPLYARPATGGRKVRHHNFEHDVNDAIDEVKHLCHVIKQSGQTNSDGNYQITFGQLFNIYVNISSKLVGTLLRARKYQYISFKGDLLLQNRDEDVIITLLKQD